jgi:hypothetical protein
MMKDTLSQHFDTIHLDAPKEKCETLGTLNAVAVTDYKISISQISYP